MHFNLVIPNTHPALAGHFPGQPIVPAALLLDQICERLQEEAGCRFRQAKQVRFLQPIKPNQLISIKCEVKNSNDYRFQCTVGDDLVVKGLLSTEAAVSSPPELFEPDLTTPIEASDLYQYLPHSGNICLLGKIVSHDFNQIQCQAKLIEENPLGECDRLSAWTSLEYAAQACALHGLLRHRQAKSPLTIAKAMVIRVKHLVCVEPLISPLANPLMIFARNLVEQPNAASYEFRLDSGKQLYGYGQVSIVFS